MPPLPLNLTEIGDARAQLEHQRRAQRAATAEHLRARAAVEALRRSGADREALASAEAQLGRLAQAARSSAAASREWLQTIGTISDRLIGERDPGVLVQALAATQPVALLPVAVQTRY